MLCDSLPEFVQRNGGCLYFSSSNAFYPLTCWLELRAIGHAMRRNSAGATRVSAFALSLFGQFVTRLILEHRLFNKISVERFFGLAAFGGKARLDRTSYAGYIPNQSRRPTLSRQLGTYPTPGRAWFYKSLFLGSKMPRRPGKPFQMVAA